MNDIPYRFFYWGPFLIHMKITPEECQMILEEGKKCRNKSNDKRSELAGHLAEEYSLTDTKKIMGWFKKYLDTYVVGYNKWRLESHILQKQKLKALWINYMKAGEFNPPHNHEGDLSFVIYPDIPQELIEENKEYKGRSCGPGAVTWMYGHGGPQYIKVVPRLPETGDLFIFPASLQHWVFPFKSNVERISISGNFHADEETDSTPIAIQN